VSKGRLETFSDGVIAILITIMVLELHIPTGTSWHALGHELPAVLAYVLSFVYLGIYWNNHHHMLAAVSRVSGGTLWANLHLLFWLSLIPFSTAWMSEHRFPSIPTAVYGIVLLAAAIAYLLLQTALLRAEGEHSRLPRPRTEASPGARAHTPSLQRANAPPDQATRRHALDSRLDSRPTDK
jgi:uncharacterized membrane protein